MTPKYVDLTHIQEPPRGHGATIKHWEPGLSVAQRQRDGIGAEPYLGIRARAQR